MNAPTRPELLGTEGMVASTHWLASATGMALLEAGGNAFDAAVGAGFVLQVVEPHLNGPGGEVPILARPAGGAVVVVNGQGPAPAAADPAAFRARGLDLVPGTGLLAACVPGAFDAWMRLLAEFGTMSLPQVLAPAIGYAERGFPLLPGVSETLARVEWLFREQWPTSAALWLREGVPPPRTLWRNVELAGMYRRVLRQAQAAGPDRLVRIEAARDAFYRGFVAEAIGAFTAGQEALLTADDLAAFRAGVEPPVTYDYQGWTVCKTGPWGQGPVFCQQLALLEGFGLDGLDVEGADFTHLATECAKLAFADREAWYGDPRFVDVPIGALLDPRYNAERRTLVGDAASLELRPGTVDGRTPVLPPYRSQEAPPASPPGTGEPTRVEGGDTCHLDIVDRAGNIVSATPSGGWLQSSPAVPGLGFCLTTRAQMFWLDEGLPGTIAPGKRPRTTLSPTLAFADDRRALAFGTPGGDTQDQHALHLFLRHVHGGLDLQAAIDAPAFATAAMPSSFWPRTAVPGSLTLERRFSPGVVAALEARGHRVTLAGEWDLGRLTAVGQEGGLLKAAANPRGSQNYAVGR